MRQILSDHFGPEVGPGAFADAVARVHCRLAGPRLRAQIGVPGAITGAYDRCERLAMRIGAGQSAEIAAVADGHARHEKIHHRRRLFAPRIFPGPLGLCQQQAGRQRNDAKQRKSGSFDLGHGLPQASDGTVTREASAGKRSQKPHERRILDGLGAAAWTRNRIAAPPYATPVVDRRGSERYRPLRARLTADTTEVLRWRLNAR